MAKRSGPSPRDASSDPHVLRLSELFRTHPVWREAARRLAPDASSKVFFRHRPGEPWRLVRRGDETRLEPGPADDPDLAFCFPPAAIEALAATRGGVGDFALALFRLMLEEDPERRVALRVIAPFPRLLRRGYVALLLRGGPRLLWFGARHGVRTLAQLQRVVDAARGALPEPWESDVAGPPAQRS
jgi:hypothetical protein